MRILFVEDNALIARAYRRAADTLGWDSSFATGVEEAAALLDVPFDVIVLDHEIVGGTGEDVFRMLQERGSKAKIISANSLQQGDYPGCRKIAKDVVVRWIASGFDDDIL